MSSPPARDCPICGRPAQRPELRPFCSSGCRDRDLIAWASEVYRLPVLTEAGDADGTGEAGEAGDPRELRPAH
jgi:endogenous inhibitor of DNA gyrase (YacG/DUF329 family)